jgi:adenylate kinase
MTSTEPKTEPQTEKRAPMNLILMGAPSSGKGTFAQLISNHFHIPTISTGELLRAEVKNATQIGLKVQELLATGQFVPDNVVIQLLKNRLSQDDTKNGFILDGFPRTLPQAIALRDEGVGISSVLELILPYEVIIQAVSGRRSCAGCQQGYNLADINFRNEIIMPPLLPKVDNTCDRCLVSPIILEQRADDKEDVIKKRLEIYDAQTKPILDYYKGFCKTFGLVIKRGKKDWPLVQQILEDQ